MTQSTKILCTTCAECGAPRVDGNTCWDMLGLIGAWEVDDAELRAEHFLTVACYNLQHPAQFTQDVLSSMRSALIDRLDYGTPVDELRRRLGRTYGGPTRVLSDPSDRNPTLRRWSMTIADVYIPDQPQCAAARVRSWAQEIRRELEP